jgi:hypothetical protein
VTAQTKQVVGGGLRRGHTDVGYDDHECDKGYNFVYRRVIRHHFHGSKANRKYTERWEILIRHGYDPIRHVKKNADGLLVPTPECPQEFLDEIFHYFEERKEDE